MMEQQTAKKRKGSKTKGCEGKECYPSTSYTDLYDYTYKRKIGEDETCPRPTPMQRASAIRNGQSIFEKTAEFYCKAGGYGDEQCDHPCECKPIIRNWSSKFKGFRKQGAFCYIDIETSADIDCKCKS